jgi:hypothetical protein
MDINYLLEYIKEEIEWNIETLVNENYSEGDIEYKKLVNLKKEDIEKIADKIYNDDGFFNIFNELMNDEITSKISDYIEGE